MTSYNQPPQWATQAPSESAPSWAQLPGGQPFSGTVQQPFPEALTNEERLAATLSHLSASAAWILSAGWLTFVGPLVAWAWYRDRSPFVRRAAAGSFNFAVAMALLSLAGWLLVFTVVLAPVGLLAIAASGVLVIVLGCLGALRTWRGGNYTYPFQLRLLS